MNSKKEIKSIATKQAPEAIGPYSQSVMAGDFLFLSGQLPIDPSLGEFVRGSIKEQTRQIFENIKAIALAAETDMNHIVKTTVFLNDMADFQDMNEAYAEYFDAVLPARSAIQAAKLPKDANIEIETIFYLPG